MRYPKPHVASPSAVIEGVMAVNRRSFICGLSGLLVGTMDTQGEDLPSGATASVTTDITRHLGAYLAAADYDALPPQVRREGVRSLVNWMGACLGGSQQEPVARAIAATAPFSGPAQASLLGRSERLDIMTAALINGIAGHVLDFDDTHMRTLIHPSVTVIPAALAVAEFVPATGREFLNAVILGMEVSCRLGNAVAPEHYNRGWHITGTAGVFGAAVGSGKLLNLTPAQMTWALGLAASQPVGLRESLGSMTKGFNAGRAASNGIIAAMLAAKGFESSDRMIESDLGWAHATSDTVDFSQITADLGSRYEVADNTYKPFPCGVVLHAAVDAALHLRAQRGFRGDAIATIDVTVNPQAIALAGRQTPTTGLESKLSLPHAVAVALMQGAAGEKQFSTAAATDSTVIALRTKVKAHADASLMMDQARLSVGLKDGRHFEAFVEHAVGSADTPMSDADLDRKFETLASDVLPEGQRRKLLSLSRGVESLDRAAALAEGARVS